MDQKEISGQEYIVEQLEEISRKCSQLEQQICIGSYEEHRTKYVRKILPSDISEEEFEELERVLSYEYHIEIENLITLKMVNNL